MSSGRAVTPVSESICSASRPVNTLAALGEPFSGRPAVILGGEHLIFLGNSERIVRYPRRAIMRKNVCVNPLVRWRRSPNRNRPIGPR
ncbi:MAG: hypothetical protein QOH67_5057 [Hyphomicrobiales bacterium]|nr:hypothetical protein [Hyphomicrobiales bacterium]